MLMCKIVEKLEVSVFLEKIPELGFKGKRRVERFSRLMASTKVFRF